MRVVAQFQSIRFSWKDRRMKQVQAVLTEPRDLVDTGLVESHSLRILVSEQLVGQLALLHNWLLM